MGFSDKQIGALRRGLNPSHVRTREAHGREFSYIEGWHAIAEANRIFGFDGWDRETIESKCVLSRENRGGYHAVYVAKVRVTVRADATMVVREGYGTGEAQSSSTGEAHERALKMAETDATKRALATFGNPFGLSLYNPVRRSRPKTLNPALPDHARRRTLQQQAPNGRYYVPARPRSVLDPAHIVGKQITDEVPATAQMLGPQLATEGLSEPAPQTGNQAKRPTQHVTKTAEESSRDDSHVSPEIAAGSEQGRLLIEWPKRHRDRAHLKFVAAQPCLICGRAPSDAHHLRFAQPRALGKKVSDEFTVPLCRTHHRQLHHSGNEVRWWSAMDGDIDPLEIARGLWEQSKVKRETDGVSAPTT